MSRFRFVTLLGPALLTLCSFSAARAGDAKTEVLAAMESLRQATLHKDGAALDKLLAADVTYTHSEGKEQTKAEVIQSTVASKTIIQKLEFVDGPVRVFGNVAIVKANVNLWYSPDDVVHMNILHVWAKTPRGWQLVARQATRLK